MLLLRQNSHSRYVLILLAKKFKVINIGWVLVTFMFMTVVTEGYVTQLLYQPPHIYKIYKLFSLLYRARW